MLFRDTFRGGHIKETTERMVLEFSKKYFHGYEKEINYK